MHSPKGETGKISCPFYSGPITLISVSPPIGALLAYFPQVCQRHSVCVWGGAGGAAGRGTGCSEVASYSGPSSGKCNCTRSAVSQSVSQEVQGQMKPAAYDTVLLPSALSHPPRVRGRREACAGCAPTVSPSLHTFPSGPISLC